MLFSLSLAAPGLLPGVNVPGSGIEPETPCGATVPGYLLVVEEEPCDVLERAVYLVGFTQFDELAFDTQRV